MFHSTLPILYATFDQSINNLIKIITEIYLMVIEKFPPIIQDVKPGKALVMAYILPPFALENPHNRIP